jgi:hypothetical protein
MKIVCMNLIIAKNLMKTFIAIKYHSHHLAGRHLEVPGVQKHSLFCVHLLTAGTQPHID